MIPVNVRKRDLQIQIFVDPPDLKMLARKIPDNSTPKSIISELISVPRIIMVSHGFALTLEF